MLAKYKKEILIFLCSFLFYFILGTILTYYLGTAKFWNVLFDLDTPRVLGDLALVEYNHYRASVHPLFVIFFQPIILLMNIIIKDSSISIVILQSILASLSVLLVYKTLQKITINKNIIVLLTLFFAFSWGQVIFSAAVETYIYAQVFLLMLWLFAVYRIDKKLTYWDYIIIVFLGVASLAITITNFIQFIIVLFFLVFLNKNQEKRFLTCVIICLIVVAIAVLLSTIQNVIWPTAPNFLTKNLNDLLTDTSEEKLYITSSISYQSIMNVLNACFAYSMNVYNLIIPSTGMYLTFQNSIITNIFSIICFIVFVILNIWFIIKTKFNIKSHKLYYAMILTLAFNLLLHLFYGNSIAYLYVCHYNFLVLFIIGYILNYFKLLNNKWYSLILCSIPVILSLRGIILMFMELFPIYNAVEYFRIIPIFIICSILIIITFLIIKKWWLKILLITIIIFGSYFTWHKLNEERYCITDCTVFEEYSISLEKYKRQLKEMRNTFNVKNYVDVEDSIDVYYFGMADRTKILYKDGKLIDFKTKEIIEEFNYDKELIIPNEYTVLLENSNGTIYRIFENSEGIFIDENGKVRVISTSKEKINLPEFEDRKYSEVLKVLHQEVLFNIDGTIPKPNIIAYNTAWYRDAFLGTKVLEYSKNTNLLIPWVTSLESIYDYSRSKDIKEADNLGELLYIIGAVGIDKEDLVKKIIKEINTIKQEDGSIKGNIAGIIQSYFPTVLAVHGAEKLGISLDLSVPMIDDGYAKLTWYHNKPIASGNLINDNLFPYLNWAYYHYAGYGTLFMLDEIYPLTYEAGDIYSPNRIESECFISEFYCEKNIYISHMWHASEMFLFLINY